MPERIRTKELSEPGCGIFKELFDLAPDAMFLLNQNHIIQDVNQIAHERLGYTKLEMVGRDIREFIAPEFSTLLDERIAKIQSNGYLIYESAMHCKDGSILPVEVCNRSMKWSGDIAYFAIVRDIKDRKQEQSRILASEKKWRLLFDNMTTGFALHDVICDEQGTVIDYRFLEVNPAYEKLTGLMGAKIIGRTVLEVLPGTEPYWIEVFGRVAKTGEPTSYENFSRELGRWYHVRVFSPKIGQFAVIVSDITDLKVAEERIQYLAKYDPLTELPNRFQLAERFDYALTLVKRSSGHMAILFIDIDRFKDINDSLGHTIGDALLVEVAARLKGVMREQDTASRHGGDEFIVILPGCDDQGAAKVAEKVRNVVAEPIHIDPYDLFITASIGIAIFPVDGINLETLSQSADAAMYRAKHEGRDNYRFFTPEMQIRADRRLRLANLLRVALERGELQLHYQPQFSLTDGSIVGVEALLRWHSQELGMVSPAEFIPVAEESGSIMPIGEWVMRTAVAQLKRWIDEGYPSIFVAVNLSAVQFRHPSLLGLVSGILEESKLPPQCLEFELTEGVAMHDPEQVSSVIEKLHELGIRIAIDDFGTGYSSLNYLKRFKIHKLKIDRSFVRDLTTDLEDKAIVAAIISMANNLGLLTMAEGVETAGQLAYLKEQGCHEAQGFYLSKPVPAEEIEKLLNGSSG
jgi:diguanylate cyclase (GGDEF)-like protein/PAS domain S-box-containing protein